MIPNILFGEVEKQQQTLLFFPRLYRKQEKVLLSQHHLKLIYNRCMRPALEATVPERMSHWPHDYESAMLRGRDAQNRLHFQAENIPQYALSDFCDRFLLELDKHEAFKDAFFCHEVRGVKNASVHDPHNEEDRALAFDEATRWIDSGKINPSDWYIDAALEVHSPGMVWHWLETARPELIKTALPSVPAERAAAAANSTKVYVDHCAQLYDLAGFRLETPAIGKLDKIKYINVYTTDKTSSYALHKNCFCRHRASELLPKGMERLLKDVEDMSRVFGQCSGAGDPDADLMEVQEGCARFEVRVRLDKALDTLKVLPERILRNGLICYPAEVWCY